MKLSDQIRKAIAASPASRYALCKETGLSEATMSRFMTGRGGLSMAMLDRIAAAIDLRVVVGSGSVAGGGKINAKRKKRKAR